MNISHRLRTCAKHTGLDAVIELLTEAADEIDALQARAQVQSDPSWWMRETDEGAEWTDTAPLVLSGWTPFYTTPQPAQATPVCGAQNAESDPQAPLSLTSAPQQAAVKADLWCIHIPGPDEVHAAPSKEAAYHMASKHNTAMATYYASGAPNLEFAPTLESVQAAVIKWPYDKSSHYDELSAFDWAAWGITDQAKKETP